VRFRILDPAIRPGLRHEAIEDWNNNNPKQAAEARVSPDPTHPVSTSQELATQDLASQDLAPRDLAHCFQRLANLDNGVFERLGRYETALWRQMLQTLLVLQSARRR
jgi:hypothetical protein